VHKRTQGRKFTEQFIVHKNMSSLFNRLKTSYLNTQPYPLHHQKSLACSNKSKAKFAGAQVDFQQEFLSDFHKKLV
jgi:hypothetical protein